MSRPLAFVSAMLVDLLLLVPAAVEKAVTTKAEAVSAEQVLASMTATGTAFDSLILNAYRNNPFLAR